MVRSRATTMVPSKCSGLGDPLGLALGRRGRHGVVEDERLHTGAGRGLRGILHGGVVVEHVEQAGQVDRLDEVAAHHGVDEHVGAGAQRVEPLARHRVAGDDHGLAAVVDAVADGGVDGLVVGRPGDDPHVAVGEHDPVGDLVHDRVRPPVEVLVVVEAVADVRLEHRLGRPYHALGADRAVDGERVGCERGDPARRDDVVEVGDVVRVQVGEQQRLERAGGRLRGGGAHEDAATAVEEQVADRGAHQRRRPGPQRIGQRAPAPQDGGLHRGSPSSSPLKVSSDSQTVNSFARRGWGTRQVPAETGLAIERPAATMAR